MLKVICKITLFAILLITWGCASQQGSSIPENSLDEFAHSVGEGSSSEPGGTLEANPVFPEAEPAQPPSISPANPDGYTVVEMAPKDENELILEIQDDSQFLNTNIDASNETIEGIRENLSANSNGDLTQTEAQLIQKDYGDLSGYKDLPTQANANKEDPLELVPSVLKGDFLDSVDDNSEDSDDDDE